MIGNLISSSAAEAARTLKSARGSLLWLMGVNTSASAQFIQLFDAAAIVSLAEVSTVDFTDIAGADLGDKYFLLNDASGLVYVWFNLDSGGTDPALDGARGIEVAVSTGDVAADIATAVATAVDADAAFSASATDAVATITDAADGVRGAIDAGTSGAAVAVTTAGIIGIEDAVPVAVVKAAAGAPFSFPLPNFPIDFGTGIVVANSSTVDSSTPGSADCFFTAVVT